MSISKKFKEDWLLFTEAGFVAVNQADEDAAFKLFRAGQALNPQNTLPQVGIGYLHLHKLELKEAIKAFEEVLNVEPDNEMAKAFMGICFSMMPNGVTKGEQILEQTVKSRDPLIKNLSHVAIDFVDRFVKKSPGPAGQA